MHPKCVFPIAPLPKMLFYNEYSNPHPVWYRPPQSYMKYKLYYHLTIYKITYYLIKKYTSTISVFVFMYKPQNPKKKRTPLNPKICLPSLSIRLFSTPQFLSPFARLCFDTPQRSDVTARLAQISFMSRDEKLLRPDLIPDVWPHLRHFLIAERTTPVPRVATVDKGRPGRLCSAS